MSFELEKENWNLMLNIKITIYKVSLENVNIEVNVMPSVCTYEVEVD